MTGVNQFVFVDYDQLIPNLERTVLMQEYVDQVRDFHQRIGAPIATSPSLLPCDTGDAAELGAQIHAVASRCRQMTQTVGDLPSRLSLSLEELAEWVESHAGGKLVAAADAWGDCLYVLLGDAVATGLPAKEIFEEIHRSNMTNQEAIMEDQAKGVKGARFVPPSLADLLGPKRQLS